MGDLPSILTVRDVAKWAKVTDKTVREWCAAGKFPNAFKVNDGWRIPQVDVEKAFLKVEDKVQSHSRIRRSSFVDR